MRKATKENSHGQREWPGSPNMWNHLWQPAWGNGATGVSPYLPGSSPHRPNPYTMLPHEASQNNISNLILLFKDFQWLPISYQVPISRTVTVTLQNLVRICLCTLIFYYIYSNNHSCRKDDFHYSCAWLFPIFIPLFKLWALLGKLSLASSSWSINLPIHRIQNLCLLFHKAWYIINALYISVGWTDEWIQLVVIILLSMCHSILLFLFVKLSVQSLLS